MSLIEQDSEGEVVVVSEHLPTNPIEMLAVAVTQGRLDVESMKGLMDLERQYRADMAKAQYATAMVKFSGLKEVVAFNTDGETAGKARFGYTDYPTLVGTVSPWMQKSGLAHSHRKDSPVIDEKGNVILIMVYCRIQHKGGHSEEFDFPAIPDERLRGKVSAVQLIQMAVTYAKRQSLCDGLGIATGEEGALDDDGNRVKPARPDEQDFEADSFDKNFPKWKQMIEKGERTVGDIMNLIASKGKLTNDMKEKLRSIK